MSQLIQILDNKNEEIDGESYLSITSNPKDEIVLRGELWTGKNRYTSSEKLTKYRLRKYRLGPEDLIRSTFNKIVEELNGASQEDSSRKGSQ